MQRIAGLVAAIAVALYFMLPGAPVDPVCIVGAGPAGLAAAAKLELKGKSVVVFEKQSQVGGKCQSIYDNNTFIPLGAFMYSNITYKESQKIIDAVGVTPVPFLSGEKWAYNWTTGDLIKTTPPPAAFSALLSHEFSKYVTWWQENFAPYNSGSGYKNGIPSEFSLTTAEWLVLHEYKALPLLFSKIMVAYGYGDFREVPMLYMLQYFSPDVAQILLRVSQGQVVQIIDFHEVFVRYAKSSIKGLIHLDTTILKIDRSQRNPVISYHQNSEAEKSQSQQCSAVMLAFPPTLPALTAAGLDLTEVEKTVFGGVSVNNYWSGAVRTDIPYGVTLTANSASPILPPDAAGQPIMVIKLQNVSDVTTVGSWGALSGKVSTAEAYNLLKQTLSSINRDPKEPRQQFKLVDDDDIVSFAKMEYFPHFDSAQLKDGLYDKFLAIQGSNKTYWVSGLNMFELVEYAIRAGQDVVDSYL